MIIIATMLLILMSCSNELFARKSVVPFDKTGVLYIADDTVIYKNQRMELLTNINVSQEVLYISNAIISFNNTKVELCYIDSQIPKDLDDYGTLKGWIKREHLAGKSDFKRVNNTARMKIVVESEDTSATYEIKTNGLVDVYFRDGSKFRGGLYKYKNLFLIGNTIFHFDGNEIKYNYGEIIVELQ